jgi:polynucleotide 5'-hydroxyl-kinase GRC3/NOL9
MRTFSVAATIVPGPGWDDVVPNLAGDTVMVVGAADRGKSHLARYLAAQAGARAALVSADVGQPSVGVPACVGMAARRPWRTADALWFVGDVSPVRHLLPIVVGTARLVERARCAGARLVVVDTSGLVDGPLGRLFKYHKAVAARATDVVVVEAEDELAPLRTVLAGVARVHTVRPAPVARARDRDERRLYRAARFRAHLRGATLLRFDARRAVGSAWTARATAPSGTLVGLLDREGVCVRLGVVDEADARRIAVWARPVPRRAVATLRLGTLAVTRRGDEVRDLATRAASW